MGAVSECHDVLSSGLGAARDGWWGTCWEGARGGYGLACSQDSPFCRQGPGPCFLQMLKNDLSLSLSLSLSPLSSSSFPCPGLCLPAGSATGTVAPCLQLGAAQMDRRVLPSCAPLSTSQYWINPCIQHPYHFAWASILQRCAITGIFVHYMSMSTILIITLHTTPICMHERVEAVGCLCNQRTSGLSYCTI